MRPLAAPRRCWTGLEDAPRIINGVFRLQVTPRSTFPSPMTLIPTYPDLPMEDVYPRTPHTDVRELYLRELGASRVAYVPWDIDRTFWDVMCVDHGRLLRNLIAWTRTRRRRLRSRARPRRRHDLASARVDDRPSRQPDQPDDDEGTASRGLAHRSAAGAHPDARRPPGPEGAALTAGVAHGWSQSGGRSRHRSVRGRARGGGGGDVTASASRFPLPAPAD